MLPLLLITGQTQPAKPWFEKFREAYEPAEGKVLRRVLPPFIPERDEFIEDWRPPQHVHQDTDRPLAVFVEWGEKPRAKAAVEGFVPGIKLRFILEILFGLKGYDVVGADELLNTELEGDWVLPEGVKVEKALDELALILQAETGQRWTFERETIEREAIFLGGKAVPPANLQEGKWVVEIDAAGCEFVRSFGGGGDLHFLIQQMSSATGWPVFLDQGWEQPSTTLYWGLVDDPNRRGSNLVEMPRDQVEVFIAELAKQTGLRLRVGMQKIARWRINSRK